MPARDVETEIKLRVADARAVRRALGRLGFTLVTRQRERDIVLDTPGARLRRAGCLLRLRRAGPFWILTYKGVTSADLRYKSRPESETHVDDGKRMLAILGGLGYRPVFRYEKIRTAFRDQTKGAVVCLDVTPIGAFLELEGPRRWIDRTARALGYEPADYITSSYGALYLDSCRARGIPPANMLFRQ